MAKNDDQDWGRYLMFGAEIAVGSILGYYVGSWLDRKYGWAPWGVLVGVMLGLAAGMYQVIREGIRVNKD